MNETQTPLTSHSPDTIQPEDNFDAIQDMQMASEASRRMMAQSITETPAPSVERETNLENERSRSRLKKIGLNTLRIAVIVAPAAFAGSLLVQASQAPDFSQETSTYVVLDGEGLQDAAEQVQGSETVNLNHVEDYISQLPENKEVLEDGLQHGEVLVIPESIAGHEEEK